MKTKLQIIVLIAFLDSFLCYGQGTFVYDQQSSIEGSSGGIAVGIQSNQPIGQSFTPSLDAVGFIRLRLGDSSFNGLGATVYLNLRSNSLNGPIVGSTEPVAMADRFVGYQDFIFQTEVSISPNSTYFFQPVVQSGDLWGIVYYNTYNYTGGGAFIQGSPVNGFDFWFREGIVVPEPSAAVLILAGLAMTRFIRKSRK